MLLTGCRREEIGGLRWDEVQDGTDLVLGADRMKGNLAHEIALLPTIPQWGCQNGLTDSRATVFLADLAQVIRVLVDGKEKIG